MNFYICNKVIDNPYRSGDGIGSSFVGSKLGNEKRMNGFSVHLAKVHCRVCSMRYKERFLVKK